MWISDQKKYFTKKALEQQQKAHTQENMAKVLFSSGIVVACITFAFKLVGFNPPDIISDLSVFLIGFLPVVAGLLKYRVDKLCWAEQAQRYRQMADIYSRAQRRIETILAIEDSDKECSPKEWNDVQHVFHDLGVTALAENANWLELRRFKGVELPN
jgi:hypothetical protein